MLDSIRKNAQSWGVKILFGLIIIVFAFWGVGSFRGNKTEILAKINGKPLLTRDFIKTYEMKLKQLNEEQPDITPEELKNIQFKRAVLQDIINQQVLMDEAQRLGFTVGAAEIQETILSIPAFRNQGDRFDPDLYRSVLQSQGISPSAFEAEIAQSIMLTKLRMAASTGVDVTDGEAYDIFQFAAERARIEYLEYTWMDHVGDFAPPEESIQEYYQANLAEYLEPPRIQISYLLFTPKALAGNEEVNDDEIGDFYERNVDGYFTEPERIHARHILIKVAENASEEEQFIAKQRIDEVYNRLQNGEDFATLARENSEGPTSVKDGDLGWFGRGQMVGPFEEAAFALNPGEVSAPVRTTFGYHLIKLEERQKERRKPMEEVVEEIRSMLAEEKASGHIDDAIDQILEQVVAGIPLEEAAQSLNMEISKSEPFSRQEGANQLSLEDASLDTLFVSLPGTVIERPLPVQQGYMLARVDEIFPETPLPLEEVREQVVRSLKRQKGMEAAEAAAKEQLDQVVGENANPLAALPTGFKESEPFSRQGFIPGLGMNPLLTNDAFNTDISQWLPSIYETDSGYIVARLKERVPPEDTVWAQQKQRWTDSIRENLKNDLFSAYLTSLYEKAEVEIVNTDYLD